MNKKYASLGLPIRKVLYGRTVITIIGIGDKQFAVVPDRDKTKLVIHFHGDDPGDNHKWEGVDICKDDNEVISFVKDEIAAVKAGVQHAES